MMPVTADLYPRNIDMDVTPYDGARYKRLNGAIGIDQPTALICAGGDGTDGEVALLKWVYGKIVNTQSEDFLGRQRELYAGRERDAVVLD
eukprot:scaffold156732_cov22-Tisochrysis_lutea.AAC.1